MTASRAVALASILVWLGCSGSSPGPVIVVHNSVRVSVSGGPEAGKTPATIDLGDRRIAVAFAAIGKLLGHDGARFEVDDSLVPKFGDGLHEAFIEALETLVTSLEYAERYEPDALAFAGEHLRTIHWTYSPSRGEVRTELDVTQQRLDVPVPADERRLLPDGLVVPAMMRAWDREMTRRYTDVRPQDVPAAEQKFYLDYLGSYHRPPAGETSVEKERREISRLGKVLELYPHIEDGEALDEAGRFIVRSGHDVRSWFAQLQQMPALAEPLRPVHARWVQWLNAYFLRLPEVEQRDLAGLFFTYSHESAPGFEAGLDVASIAKPAMRSWLSRHEDKNRHSFDTRDALDATVVCPYPNENHQFSSSYQSCNGLLYTALSQQGRSYGPLLQLLAGEQSPLFTQFAALNLLNNLGADAASRFLEESWGDKPRAQAALVAFAEYSGWGARSNRRKDLPELSPEPFLRRLPGWWRTHPELRPELLYLLVTLGDEYEGTVVWPKLHHYLGGSLSGQEVAGFLQQSPRTIWYLRNFVHSVSDGWSRSKMMIPELERFLNDFNAAGGGEPSPYYVTERCLEFLCITGAAADVVALQAFLRDRVERYPSEARSLNSFIEATPGRSCPSAKAAAERDAKAAKPSVFFGD